MRKYWHYGEPLKGTRSNTYGGRFAVNLHGFGRKTADADIWLKNTLQNRKSFRRAMSEMGYGDYPQFETMDMVPGWSAFTLNSGLELDLMTSLAGFEEAEFDACYELASIAEIHGRKIPFLHVNHLMKEKEIGNRPKDQIDLLELRRIKNSPAG